MKNIIQLSWSLMERLIPRISSAALLLGLATLTDPATVGIFSAVILSLTFYQGAVEGTIRQVAVVFVSTPSSSKKLRRLLWFSSLGGAGIVSVALAILLLTTAAELWADVWLLTPLAVVPLVASLSIMPMVALQRSGRWGRLASIRLTSSVVALAGCLPMVIFGMPLIACALYPLLSELVFTVKVRRERMNSHTFDSSMKNLNRSMSRELISLGLFRTLGWAEGQTDRLLIASIAGTAKLGQYSTSIAIGRSGGDAVSDSTANVLRARLANLEPDALVDEWKLVTKRTLMPGVAATGLGVIVIWLICQFILPRFLSGSWAATLTAAPVIALSAVPAFFTFNLSTIVAVRGAAWKIMPIRILGVLSAVPIAFAALKSLELAAWLVVGRELIVSCGIAMFVTAIIPRSIVVFGGATIVILSLALFLL